MNLALIGPSGVGKGTVVEQLIAKFNLLHLVTGELFREKLEKRRALGILAKKYMARGELVPDELVDAMVEEWLWDAPADKGILFDGFPRTINQARFLDLLFAEMGRRLEAVIYLKASDEVVLERLLGRIICHTCQTPYHLKFRPPARPGLCDRCGGQLYQRPDDIPEIARVRLRAFYRVTGPVLDYYQETKRLIIIDGAEEIQRVTQTLLEAIEAVQHHKAKFAAPEEVAELKNRLKIIAPTPALRESIHLVLIGGPGSGKGTQADYLKNALKLQHISTGDLFRENLKNKTDLGLLAKTYMDRGELVSDEVTEAMVEERLSRLSPDEGFILDGFPRTLPQAEALTEIMAELHRQLNGVLYIRVSEAEIVERLSGRLICRECQSSFHKIYNPFKVCPYNKCNGEYLYQRDDDNPETIKSRLKTFHNQTAPLTDYYKEAGLLIEVDGEGDVSAVKERMLTVVQNLVES